MWNYDKFSNEKSLSWYCQVNLSFVELKLTNKLSNKIWHIMFVVWSINNPLTVIEKLNNVNNIKLKLFFLEKLLFPRTELKSAQVKKQKSEVAKKFIIFQLFSTLTATTTITFIQWT